MKVVKFGGSSMATGGNIMRCADIVKRAGGNIVIVVSAPGKFGIYTEKITDQLINRNYKVVFNRFNELADMLLLPSLRTKFYLEMYKIKKLITQNCEIPPAFAGEYLTAKLFSLYLGYKFYDAKDVIVIKKDHSVNLSATNKNIKKLKLKKELPFVIGGFYGTACGSHSGNRNCCNIALLSRGGSDYTGAVLAKLMNAAVYEKYTDGDGVYGEDGNTILRMNYEELNKHDFVHQSVAALLKNSRTKLKIANTFSPDNFTIVAN
jgi:aspartate kinase